MAKVDRYSLKGTKMEGVTLPKDFIGEVNLPLLAQARRVYEALMHDGLRKTKTRAEVNRTGKKIYKQKGTGGARHGSRRAPIYVGGGVALGPRPIERQLGLSSKMKAVAKMDAIALKVDSKAVLVLDGVDKVGKTKEASQVFAKLAKITEAKKFTFAFAETNKASVKYFSNLGNVKTVSYRTINAFQILRGGYLVLDGDIFAKPKAEAKAEVKPVAKPKKEIKAKTK